MRARSSLTPLAVSRPIGRFPAQHISLEDLERKRIIKGPDFLPILGERLSFFVAGPPGCGKSTTASDLMNLIPNIPKFLFSDVEEDRAFDGVFPKEGDGRLNRIVMKPEYLSLLSPKALITESRRIQIANQMKKWGVYNQAGFEKYCSGLGLLPLSRAKEVKPAAKKIRTEIEPETAILPETYGLGATAGSPAYLHDYDDEDELTDEQKEILSDIKGDCWVVFDDVDKIRDPAVSKLVSRLMDNIVANGRSHETGGDSHIHIIVTNHSLNDYRLTKYSCENCDYWVIFPNKSMKQQVQRLLSKMGLEKEPIYNEDRVIIHKSVPLFIITPRFIKMLS